MISGIIAIVRLRELADLEMVASTLFEEGIQTIELTLNTPGALEAVTAIRQKQPQIFVGAGTILKAEDAREAIDAGAQFVVTPTLQFDSIAVAKEAGVPILAGAMTPTEILAAHSAGADFVKLFPAGSLGLDYIKSILGPLPFVKIVPTGGVSLNNVKDYLKVCPAVGIGSNLVAPELVATEDWDSLRRQARAFVEATR